MQTILQLLSLLAKYIETIILLMTVLWHGLISALLVTVRRGYEDRWMQWKEGERLIVT